MIICHFNFDICLCVLSTAGLTDYKENTGEWLRLEAFFFDCSAKIVCWLNTNLIIVTLSENVQKLCFLTKSLTLTKWAPILIWFEDSNRLRSHGNSKIIKL